MQKRETVTAKQLLELVKRQQFRCALSGRTLTPETASLDHIVPLGRGGSHDISNLWILEHRVNAAKGTQLVSEFLDMCQDVVHANGSSEKVDVARGLWERSQLITQFVFCETFQNMSIHGQDFRFSDKTGASSGRGETSNTTVACRSMGTGDRVLRHSADYKGKANEHSVDFVPRQQQSTSELGFRSSNGIETEPSKSPEQPGFLDVRIENQSVGVADEENGNVDFGHFRPSELVRILNSTHFGSVINDRQLFRHRQAAPWIEVVNKKISLAAYVGFLVQKRHKAIAPKARRVAGKETITVGQARQVLERQAYRCALTGEILTPSNFALDHIVPVANGGNFAVDNAQFVLKSVNRAKNTMSQTEFIEMCRKVAAYQCKLAESDSERNPNED